MGGLLPIFANKSGIITVTDFNEIKEAGIYSVYEPPLNSPDTYTVEEPSMLIVISASKNDTGRLVQNLIMPITGKNYSRIYSRSTDQWSEWKLL